ncbi:MAG: two-component sensor histidine kinase [Rhodocyclales bacterium]|nr:two-component sensor histidine kinase [Rhodocyclales bacterium]
MNDVFDRSPCLADLLPGPLLEQVCGHMAALLEADTALLDPAGRVVWGTPAANAERSPLVLELEPIGHLAAPVAGSRLQAAAALLRDILLARHRLLMASRLHVESIAADYADLLEQHAALQASEARYKELSAELEQRVAAQVKLLDERQRQLYQAENLASLGRLAAGVAHEINNPIGFVRSNLSSFAIYLQKFAALKERLNDAAAAWQALEIDYLLKDGADLVTESIGGIDRVARIVGDLKGFSNVDRAEEEVVDLNENLRQVVSVLQGQLPAGVSIDAEYGQLPRLLCLPGHLNQVFVNIVRNGVQAIGDSNRPGVITIRTQAVDGGIEVSVGDSGVGMTPEQRERAFDPFFTTRDVGKGTGLGLTVARDIVQAHGGRLAIDSRFGFGTTVTLFLPA